MDKLGNIIRMNIDKIEYDICTHRLYLIKNPTVFKGHHPREKQRNEISIPC